MFNFFLLSFRLSEIGVGLTTFGVFFLFMGVMFFFDSALLALGNIMFVAGVVMVIGLQNTALFFWKRSRGAVCFLGGIFLVLIGWPVIGMLVEVFGIFNLFGSESSLLPETALFDAVLCQKFFPAHFYRLSRHPLFRLAHQVITHSGGTK